MCVLGGRAARRVAGQAREWVKGWTLHGGVSFVQTLETCSSSARFSAGIATHAHPVTAPRRGQGRISLEHRGL